MSDSDILNMLVEQNKAMMIMVTELFSQNMKKKEKPKNLIDGDEYISAGEALLMLKCCDKTLRKYRKEGKLIFSNPYGKNFRYSKNSIISFLIPKN